MNPSFFSFVRAIAATTSRKTVKAIMDAFLSQMAFQQRRYIVHPRNMIFFTALHKMCLFKLTVNVLMSEQMAAMLFIKIVLSLNWFVLFVWCINIYSTNVYVNLLSLNAVFVETRSLLSF